MRTSPALLVLLLLSAPALALDDALPSDERPSGASTPATSEAAASPPTGNDPVEVVELPAPPKRISTVDLTRPADEIWERIRRGFTMPDLDSALVVEHQLFYLNRPGFLKRVLERGGRYLYHIVDELEARSLPTELALLPMIESAYNPLALSPSNASGLWQFIPSTGRNFNLTQNKWVDERRDITASTSAALDYLETIYHLQGDWHLALASYNWGEGAVGRALQRNEIEGLPAEYSHLRMPEQTRNYIPKLQALKNIIANPELFGLTLPYLPNEPYFETVEVPSGLDLATAARLAEVPLDELIALNPGFNSPIIFEKGRELAIPVANVARFRNNLAARPRDAGKWQTYQLKRGEKLETLAARLKVPVQALREINGLSAKSKTTPGQSLIIPNGNDYKGVAEAARLLAGRSLPELGPLLMPGKGGLGLR